MKPFKEYIIESTEEKILPTLEWMKEHYKMFNEMYFDNKLPECKLEVSTDMKKISLNTFGNFSFENRVVIERRYRKMKLLNSSNVIKEIDDVRDLKPIIRLNGNIKFTENDMEDTMIHEMIHYWTYKDLIAPKQGHGPEFRRKCDSVRYKAKHTYNKSYELTIYSDMAKHEYNEDSEDVKKFIERQHNREEKKLNAALSLLIQLDPFKVGKHSTRIITCNEKYLQSIVDTVKRIEVSRLKEIILSRNSYKPACEIYGDFGLSRKYRYYYAEDYMEFYKLIKNDENKEYLYKSMNESKEKYESPDMIEFTIPANFNLSWFDCKENVDLIEKAIKKDLTNTLHDPE